MVLTFVHRALCRLQAFWGILQNINDIPHHALKLNISECMLEYSWSVSYIIESNMHQAALSVPNGDALHTTLLSAAYEH